MNRRRASNMAQSALPRRRGSSLKSSTPSHLSPPQFAIAVFTGLIVLFTVLLSLPIASSAGTFTPLPQALFTASSSISVTGLAVVNMATHWSVFGNVLILLAVELGGIGVLTLASVMGLIVTRRLGLRQRLMAASDSNAARIHSGPVSEGQAVRLGEITGMLRTIAMSSLAIELVLALAIFPRLLLTGRTLWESTWQSFYIAVSAFTNTGFLPIKTGMDEFATDPWFLGVLALGVFLGSIGYPVIFVLLRQWRTPRRWNVHVKLTLITTAILLVVGGVAFTALEWSNPATFAPEAPGVRVMWGGFLSVMTRSGGFAPFDVGAMHPASLLVGDMLMFVGGGSASTAGGIKVTTLAVLFLAARAEARGVDEIEVFDRRIPGDVLRLAVSVLLWGGLSVAFSCLGILLFVDAPLDFVLFDVISAFATSGLSTGLTETLPDPAILVLSVTMWAGRVGTVTLAAALAARRHRQLFRHPEERPIVG